jgi:hypothetical protein
VEIIQGQPRGLGVNSAFGDFNASSQQGGARSILIRQVDKAEPRNKTHCIRRNLSACGPEHPNDLRRCSEGQEPALRRTDLGRGVHAASRRYLRKFHLGGYQSGRHGDA